MSVISSPSIGAGGGPSHKLALPEAHHNAVVRRRLLAVLFDAPPPRVAVLQAPAGHGKTSLMIQAAAQCGERGMLTGWLSLDESDDDVSRLYDQLFALIEMLAAQGDGCAPVELPSSGTMSRAERLTAQLSSFRKPVAIFLDDVHFVRSRSTLALLADLLKLRLRGVRWFIGTRTNPEVGIPKLVVGGDALVLHADALCFSAEEAREFFQQSNGPKLKDTELATITEVTEGWPAALQLYRLAGMAAGIPAPGAHYGRGAGELADYLVHNVLEFQEPEIRDFLLTTSFLEQMTADLCDEVAGRSDSAEVLAVLERRGLFVRRLASDGGWFTYHALFSRFLRDQQARRAPKELERSHRRAAQWYERHNNHEEALRHYAACGDDVAAADVFEVWTESLVPSGYMVTVERWLDAMKMSELEKRPSLVVKIIWAITFLSRHQKLDPLLSILNRAARGELVDTGRAAENPADPLVAQSMVLILEDRLIECGRPIQSHDVHGVMRSRFRTFELSAVSNARGYIAMAEGDLPKALTCLARGRELSERCGGTFTLAYSVGKTALTLLSQGRLPESLALFRSALADASQHVDGSLSEACLVSGYIAALYEANESDLALEEFERFRDVIEEGAIHDYLVIAYRAIARIHDEQGRPAEAIATLDAAEGMAHGSQWPRAARQLVTERARRELMAGRLDRAELIFGPIEGESDGGRVVRISEEVENEDIGRIRLLIARGEASAALAMMRPVLRRAVQHGRVLRQVKLTVLAAAARATLGDERTAHRHLSEALALAAPGGCAHSILDEGPVVRKLLREHRELRDDALRSIADSEVREFLELLVCGEVRDEPRIPAPKAGPPVLASALKPLTEREKDVLRMLSNYMTNSQIAQASFVSNDTVKYHLKNIYSKLRAKNRMDAIRIAHEMGYR